jgi:hypothetical protein
MPILTIWLSAFIPKFVPGYTRLLTAGKHTGKTAIPLPAIARTWPGNWLNALNAGYLTDQRDFDDSLTASARMQSIAEVDLAGPSLRGQTHRSSGTTEVNLVTGKQTGFAVADMSRCTYKVVSGLMVIGQPAPGTYGTIDLSLVGKAGDPLVGMAADIDYDGTFRVLGGRSPGSLSVTFAGKIDDFPAYDCYASLGDVTKLIFKSPPPPGNTVADLLGPPVRPVYGTAEFP